MEKNNGEDVFPLLLVSLLSSHIGGVVFALFSAAPTVVYRLLWSRDEKDGGPNEKFVFPLAITLISSTTNCYCHEVVQI